MTDIAASDSTDDVKEPIARILDTPTGNDYIFMIFTIRQEPLTLMSQRGDSRQG